MPGRPERSPLEQAAAAWHAAYMRGRIGVDAIPWDELRREDRTALIAAAEAGLAAWTIAKARVLDRTEDEGP